MEIVHRKVLSWPPIHKRKKAVLLLTHLTDFKWMISPIYRRSSSQKRCVPIVTVMPKRRWHMTIILYLSNNWKRHNVQIKVWRKPWIWITCYVKCLLFIGERGITRELICKNGKIVLPSLLQKHIIDWYHTILCHPGINRLLKKPLLSTYGGQSCVNGLQPLFRTNEPAKRTKENSQSMATYHQKKQRLKFGIKCALI